MGQQCSRISEEFNLRGSKREQKKLRKTSRKAQRNRGREARRHTWRQIHRKLRKCGRQDGRERVATGSGNESGTGKEAGRGGGRMLESNRECMQRLPDISKALIKNAKEQRHAHPYLGLVTSFALLWYSAVLE